MEFGVGGWAAGWLPASLAILSAYSLTGNLSGGRRAAWLPRWLSGGIGCTAPASPASHLFKGKVPFLGPISIGRKTALPWFFFCCLTLDDRVIIDLLPLVLFACLMSIGLAGFPQMHPPGRLDRLR